jgi:hypothetical protein
LRTLGLLPSPRDVLVKPACSDFIGQTIDAEKIDEVREGFPLAPLRVVIVVVVV